LYIYNKSLFIPLNMKQTIMLVSFVVQLFFTAKAQKNGYDAYPFYQGKDLGLQWSPRQSIFKVWSPSATEMELRIYADAETATPEKTLPLVQGKNGVWAISVPGNLLGKLYTFRALHQGRWADEVPDPYAKAVGTNGKRAMVVDLAKTDPQGWGSDKAPVLKNPTDAIVYELHVRDASIAANSGIRQKGLFVGLTEKGTRNAAGLATGLDHLKELGITHVHLLPSFDYNSVDESQPGKAQYNWGYDPLNYNVPEGSYATNAADGVSRIREFKQLVHTFHQNGLGVIMDVVYNHTAQTEKSNFNQLVPGYYYRQNDKGGFSDASACGNETASDRPMMQKFMLESLIYWVKEYHVDGFRFDLMGIHDIATMNLIAAELRKIKPGILLYGEGWTAGASPLPENQRAVKANAAQLNGVAVFSDDLRDGIKGSVFDINDRGFASGKPGMEESIKFGITAACQHPQVDYTKVNYSKKPYAAAPGNTISYCECHDNHVLWDKLALSAKDATVRERQNMHELALSIVLTSQGIAFLHAGTEFLRSKQNVENSYNSPDSINAIDWSLKTKNKPIFDYVRALIAMRKAHPAFRLTTAAQVAQLIRFEENLPPQMVAYTINGAAVKDSWKKIWVGFNGSNRPQSLALPSGSWQLAINDNMIAGGTVSKEITVGAYGCTVLYQY
jgi:pullulanase